MLTMQSRGVGMGYRVVLPQRSSGKAAPSWGTARKAHLMIGSSQSRFQMNGLATLIVKLARKFGVLSRPTASLRSPILMAGIGIGGCGTVNVLSIRVAALSSQIGRASCRERVCQYG